MDKNELALLELIKSSLFDIPPQLPENVEWEKVFEEAKAQTVVALVARAVPKEFSAMWEISAAQSEAHFMRAVYEQTRLSELMDKEGIPFVIIKGAAAAVCYPKPVARTMGDIDLLVPEESFGKAFSALEGNGYKFEHDMGDGRDYTFTKGEIEIELHRRYSDKEYDIDELLISGIKNARTLTIYGNPFRALPEAENALLLLDHIRHHLLGGLGLRQIIDFMMAVNSVNDEKRFEKEFLPLFEQAGLGTFVRVVTKMCGLYLGLEKNTAWCDGADDEACRMLMENVLLSGNFGRKNPYVERPLRSLTMSFKTDGFFKTLQKAGMETCPIFKKYRVLKPFAWIYQIFRYIKRGLAALFKGDTFKGDVSDGKERAEFYKRLGIKR